jgi:DNA-binding MarR family transcriptional regulator
MLNNYCSMKRSDPKKPSLTKHAVSESPPETPKIDYGVLPSLVGYQLRLAQQRVFANFAKHFGPFGLTPGLLGLLILVERNPGLKQGELAAALGIDRSTIVNSIDRLQQMAMIVRTPDKNDRRAHRINLNPEFLASVMPVLLDTLQTHEAEIAPDGHKTDLSRAAGRPTTLTHDLAAIAQN